jgi:hypothetical protein
VDAASEGNEGKVELVDGLESAIDKTPNSSEEQREIRLELRSMKKELSLKRREAKRDNEAGQS